MEWVGMAFRMVLDLVSDKEFLQYICHNCDVPNIGSLTVHESLSSHYFVVICDSELKLLVTIAWCGRKSVHYDNKWVDAGKSVIILVPNFLTLYAIHFSDISSLKRFVVKVIVWKYELISAWCHFKWQLFYAFCRWNVFPSRSTH